MSSLSPVMILGVVFLCGAIGIAGMFMAYSVSEDDTVDKGSRDERLDAILDRLEESDARMQRLERRLEQPGQPVQSGMTKAEVESLLAHSLKGLQTELGSGVKPAAMAGQEENAFDLKSALSKLSDPKLSDAERMEIWASITKNGHADSINAYLEKAAKDQPGSAKAQYELGAAYISQLRSGNLSQQEMGLLGTKADEAFNRTLAIDEEHWEARFQKAISLSFWPPIMGRQGEARRHFEVLIEQQSRRQQDPSHAQTHLLLGNLLQQMGKTSEAQSAWQSGAQLFPQNAALRAQLQNSGN